MSPYRMREGSPHRYSDKNTFQSSQGGYMGSTHSPYRASSPGRKFSDYLSEPQNVGQDNLSNKYR